MIITLWCLLSPMAPTLSYGTYLLTFDELRSKLIHYEQQLKFLKTKESFGV